MLIQFILCLTLATLASLDQVEVLVNEYSVCQKSLVFYLQSNDATKNKMLHET